MTQREAKVSRKIMDKLRMNGTFCFKVWGSAQMMAGLPDIIGCHKGMFFGLETKTPDKRDNTSSVQDRIMGMIRQAGGFTDVVCGPQEAWDKLELAYASHIERLTDNDD